jgi:thioredoxin-like negative regulator of GroEL
LNIMPSTYLIKDGKAIDIKEGYMGLQQLEEWLKKNEYLPK